MQQRLPILGMKLTAGSAVFRLHKNWTVYLITECLLQEISRTVIILSGKGQEHDFFSLRADLL
jgi:hypothetical protein